MPSRVLSFKTPRQCLLHLYPNTKMMSMLPYKIFGCVVYVLVPSHLISKLDQKTVRCIFLGYSNNQKDYKCYCPTTRKMFVSLDVKFDERHAYYSSNSSRTNSENSLTDYWSILDISNSAVTNTSNEFQGISPRDSAVSPVEDLTSTERENNMCNIMTMHICL